MPLFLVHGGKMSGTDSVGFAEANDAVEACAQLEEVEPRWGNRRERVATPVDELSLQVLTKCLDFLIRINTPDNCRVPREELARLGCMSRKDVIGEVNRFMLWQKNGGDHPFYRPQDEIDRQILAERMERCDRWIEWKKDTPIHGLDELTDAMEAEMRDRVSDCGLDPAIDVEAVSVIAQEVRSDWALKGPGSIEDDPSASLVTKLWRRKQAGKPPRLEDLTPEMLQALYDSGATTVVLEDLFGVQEEIRDLRDKWGVQADGLAWDRIQERTILTRREKAAISLCIDLLETLGSSKLEALMSEEVASTGSETGAIDVQGTIHSLTRLLKRMHG